MPEINSPESSHMPNLKAAINPMTDQSKGIMRSGTGIFLSVRSSKPRVNMVVGQGSPNVGADGYQCPMKIEITG